MKNILISSLLISSFITSLHTSESNSSILKVKSEDSNITESQRVAKEVQNQIEREKKYAKEKTFYQGSDYNLSEAEVNPNSLSKVPKLEPDYDFDMDDAYSDVQ